MLIMDYSCIFFLIAMKIQSNPPIIVFFVVGMCEKMFAPIEV